MSGGLNNIKVAGQPMRTLVSYLEKTLEKPVEDQTDLSARYDFELKWTGTDSPPQLDLLKRALAEQLGLEVVPSREKIEMLIVERVKE